MCKENTLIHQADLSGITSSKQVLDETTAQIDGFRCLKFPAFQPLFKPFLDSWLNEIQIRLKCIAVKGKHPHTHYKCLTWGDIAQFCLDSVSAHIKILAKNFQLACALQRLTLCYWDKAPLTPRDGGICCKSFGQGTSHLLLAAWDWASHSCCCSPSSSSQRMQKGAEGGGSSLCHMRNLRQSDLIVPLNILPLEHTDQFSQ